MPGKRKFGTGDVFPQWMVFSGEQTGVGADTTITVPMPINAYRDSGLVLEALKVRWNYTQLTDNAGGTAIVVPVTTSGAMIAFGLTTNPNGMGVSEGTGNNYNADPHVLMCDKKFMGILATAVGQEFPSIIGTEEVDLQDQNGHGQMIVTPNLYLTLKAENLGKAIGVHVRILYRTRRMALQEYLGYFQSQQPQN